MAWRVSLQREAAGYHTPAQFEHEQCTSAAHLHHLTITHKLKAHTGCVNSVAWTPDGRHILTGSDDQKIIIWDASTKAAKMRWDSKHYANVFSAKLLSHHLDAGSQVVSCGADGQVRLHTLRSEHSLGSKRLYEHDGRAHKLAITSDSFHLFTSVGEDGRVVQFDLRQAPGHIHTHLFTVCDKRRDSLSLNIADYDPTNSHFLLVAGNDPVVRIFDLRKFNQPAAQYCPEHLRRAPQGFNGGFSVTGAQFNFNGTQIVATYNDEYIYVFDHDYDDLARSSQRMSNDANYGIVVRPRRASEALQAPVNAATTGGAETEHRDSSPATDMLEDCNALPKPVHPDIESEEASDHPVASYAQQYRGSRNCDTVKGVIFWGPRSEYVMSGCDTGHLFIWRTKDAKLINVLKGDDVGAINCLAPHPSGIPVLLTSGLEDDATLWEPVADNSTFDKERAERICQENDEGRQRSSVPDLLQMIAFSLAQRRRGRVDDDEEPLLHGDNDSTTDDASEGQDTSSASSEASSTSSDNHDGEGAVAEDTGESRSEVDADEEANGNDDEDDDDAIVAEVVLSPDGGAESDASPADNEHVIHLNDLDADDLRNLLALVSQGRLRPSRNDAEIEEEDDVVVPSTEAGDPPSDSVLGRRTRGSRQNR
jgi:WD repeat-containing protein 42A